MNSAGVAERGGDAGDRAEQRPLGARSSPRAVAAQQLDLDRVHRVDVRVAQLGSSAAATGWRSSSAVASTISSTAADGALVLGRDRGRRAGSGSARRDEVEVAARDLQARLRERHLEVLDERAEERPTRGRGGAARATSRAATASAVPQPYHAGQQAAVLRPGEHPGDRAQRAQVVARRRAAAPGASRSRAARARRPA